MKKRKWKSKLEFVKIVCAHNGAWYEDIIGQCFFARNVFGNTYYIDQTGHQYDARGINKYDCLLLTFRIYRGIRQIRKL